MSTQQPPGGPYFVDRHCHPLFAARERATLSLIGCETIDQITALLRKHIALNPGIEWIDAAPFDRTLASASGMEQSEMFIATALDVASDDVSITLHSTDHHALWVNSAALRAAGLTEKVPKLADGHVACDESGRASGLLLEWSAMKLVLDKMPAPTLEADLGFLNEAQDTLLANGIFAVTDAWIDEGMGEVYVEALKRGLLRMSVELFVRVDPIELDQQLRYLEKLFGDVAQANNFAKTPATGSLRVSGIKVFIDGVLSSNTAQISGGYANETKAREIWSKSALNQLIERLARISPLLRPHFHAIGDLAVSQALDAIEHARHMNLWAEDFRPAIAHAEVVAARDIDRMADLDVEVVISPQWLGSPAVDGCGQTYENAGDFEPMLRAGVRLSYGSDWPVSAPDPQEAINRASMHLVEKGYNPLDALEKATKIVRGDLLTATSSK